MKTIAFLIIGVLVSTTTKNYRSSSTHTQNTLQLVKVDPEEENVS